MRFFIRHQPENLTLVVLSRNLPQLGIANLRVRDQLLEIGSQQLAFTHQEAKQFLIAVCHRRLKPQKAVGFAMTFPARRRFSQLIALSARQNTHSAHKSARRLAESIPAIFRIIWSMRFWITSISQRAIFC